jgi:hypothetical protein
MMRMSSAGTAAATRWLALAVALAVAVVLALTATGAGAARAQPAQERASTPAGGDVPRLDFATTPGYEDDVARLRRSAPPRLRTLMDRVGLGDAGDPIQVVLAPESHPLARGVPAGVAGYAIPRRDLAVLLPERVPRYPYDSLEVLLLHEVAHVLVARAAGDHDVPRWFNEGLALVLSRGWSLGDRSRVVLGAVSGVPADTRQLEASFEGRSYDVANAYALSGALVHHLVARHGRELVPATLARVAAGEDFEDAFAAVAGVSLRRAEAAFWGRYRLLYRWIPFVTSGAALWAGVTALAVLAGVRRRQRDAEIRRRWDEEEQAAALARLRSTADDAGETIH